MSKWNIDVKLSECKTYSGSSSTAIVVTSNNQSSAHDSPDLDLTPFLLKEIHNIATGNSLHFKIIAKL